ncbi:glycosyl hydrolase [Demequina maris]|uniref:glycosyl hydrolase n=1 Tax=Demequina maris TaxID=1638982 RepID=UPI00078627C8|nr:glycosyl hydrolase [Demequina maris]
MRRIAAVATLAGVLALAGAGCTASDEPDAVPATVAAAGPREDGPDPSILPTAADAGVATRLAADVVPPTNRWYSALAFGDPGLPVFPAPLSFQAVDGGFAMGLTRPDPQPAAILAPAVAELTVTVAGASGFGEVTAAGPVGVTLTTGPVELTLAQGVPVVAVTSDGGAEATLSTPFEAAGDDLATATVGETEYGIALDRATVDGTTLALDPGGSAQLFAVPEGGDAAAFASALGPVVAGADASFALGEAATTTIGYADEPTVVAVPAARAVGLDCGLGSYATIHGTYEVCRASSVSWDVPLVEPSAALDLGGLTGAQRDAIAAAFAADAGAEPELPADTYFGAKALYRLANLLQVADALGEDAFAEQLQGTLETQLDLWGAADGCAERAERCFTYDPALRGVVGLATAFGSEQFNDHHFHYGYLLYAAAVAGARDPELAERIGPVMDLVAEDIAAPGTSDAFPVRRAFDPVEGHSWASGISPFADGNNQESSSEAALAWNAVALWADLRGDDALGASARWMLSAESEAATRLWLAPDLTGLDGYAHPIVAIEWGAKRDYATWFSDDPAAMLGIQVIPAQPAAAGYLAAVPADRIVAAVDEAWGQTTPSQFADYLLMYRALAGDEERAAAWAEAIELPDSAIDDGDSRTWMLAWIAAAGRSAGS